MFTTCSSANRVIEQPLITTFTRQFVDVDAATGSDYWLYTRIRRAQYKYVGCTKACAVAKAKELNLLYNRYIPTGWAYNASSQAGYRWAPYSNENFSNEKYYGYKQCGTATVTKEGGADAYQVSVSLQEELPTRYEIASGATAQIPWEAFEENPDIVTNRFRSTLGNVDFEYDGII